MTTHRVQLAPVHAKASRLGRRGEAYVSAVLAAQVPGSEADGWFEISLKDKERLSQEWKERRLTLRKLFSGLRSRDVQLGFSFWGPGDVLPGVIRVVTGQTYRPGCSCKDRVRKMNGWGWRGSWVRRQTILGWLVQEAQKQGYAVAASRPTALLRAAGQVGWRHWFCRDRFEGVLAHGD